MDGRRNLALLSCAFLTAVLNYPFIPQLLRCVDSHHVLGSVTAADGAGQHHSVALLVHVDPPHAHHHEKVVISKLVSLPTFTLYGTLG